MQKRTGRGSLWKNKKEIKDKIIFIPGLVFEKIESEDLCIILECD